MPRANKRVVTQSAAPSSTQEETGLKLSAPQRRTILQYTDLPAPLAAKLSAQSPEETVTPFSLDELDDLLDEIEVSTYRAKGNDKQKVLRIADKIAGRLGSRIDAADFSKRGRAKPTSTIYQIKISLRGIYPRIWRRIQTRDCTLEQLHALIQLAMGWDFGHPYSFDIGGVEFADLEFASDEEIEDAFTTILSAVLPLQNRRPRFEYLYDFGDEWVHQLIVEERFPPQTGVKYPLCVAGARACPPEDCGGAWGYARFLDAIADPSKEGNDEMLEWLGPFDPEAFDANMATKEMRRRN